MIEVKNRHTGAVLLRRETLRGADLRCADLRDASLLDANLRCADLRCADLRWVNLRWADLQWADLRRADLRRASLRRADLRGANLRGANLQWADLRGADLQWANLRDTVLDPEAAIPPVADKAIVWAGLELDGDWVLGWRTAQSQFAGRTVYRPGTTHVAPVFSVCPDTDCHPGLYLAGREWLECHFSDAPLVRVRCRRADLHRAGGKWRCRRLEVLP